MNERRAEEREKLKCGDDEDDHHRPVDIVVVVILLSLSRPDV